MGIAMRCHDDHVNAMLRRIVNSVGGNPLALPQWQLQLLGWSYWTRYH